MQQASLYQNNRQQLFMFAAAIFGSITAAVIVSTLVIMSLLHGEIANALSSNVQNAPTTTQAAGTCVAPATTDDSADTSAPAESSDATATSAAAPLMHSWLPGNVNNSFNSSNVSNTTTTNNVTNTEVHNKKTTVIKDSFNDNSEHNKTYIKDSFNPVVIKDNDVKINSDNNTKVTNVDVDKTYNWNSNNVTVASNNVNVDSNNTENHVLSDNNVLVAPLVVGTVVQKQ